MQLTDWTKLTSASLFDTISCKKKKANRIRENLSPKGRKSRSTIIAVHFADNTHLASNAGQFLQMLRDLEQVGITNIAVDRCPRCDVFTVIATQSLQSLADVHFILATLLATALQRANLYLAHAVEEAQQGNYDEALLVALETVGHVTVEDPRVHLLIAMLALARKDRRLLQEAQTLLSHFWAKEALENLVQMERTGTLDFTIFQTRMTE